MICCEKCFRDSEILALFAMSNDVGRCGVCGRRNVRICNLDTELGETIKDNIANLLDSYLPCYPQIKRSYTCAKHAKPLAMLLLRDTEIFNLSEGRLRRLINGMFPNEKYLECDYVSKVDIARERNEAVAWILPGGDWCRFEEAIKYESRFSFANRFSLESFKRAVLRCTKTIPDNIAYFRSRKLIDRDMFCAEEMGAPPRERCISGRLNPSGIQLLYLADSVETALYEMRPRIKEKFCVAQFVTTKCIKVLDLTQVDKMSPFSDQIDPYFYLLNIDTLKRINKEFQRVVDGANNDLDYLITQYICDVVKQCGWSGVMYSSTLRPGGINLAVFNPEDANVVKDSLATYEISQTQYDYAQLNYA